MLRFERLILEDFGPYKGRQEVVFPDAPGLIFILGENGRGKSHLLNAFRYALLGKVYGRYERHREDLTGLANSESARDRGHAQLSVSLVLTKDGTRYEVKRHFEVRPNGSTREEVLLTRDGDVLNQTETASELSRLMPEQIHQFFLFDSELLQKYENLLDANNPAGDELKEAIERILGVPILKNARNDVAAVANDTAKQLEAAARSETRTQRYADEMAALRVAITQRDENAKVLDSYISERSAELDEVERDMQRSARLREVLGKRDSARDRRVEEESKLLAAEDQLKVVGASAWRAVLRPVLHDIVGAVAQEAQRTREEYAKASAQVEIRRQLQDAGDGRCPLCDQKITDEHRHVVLDRLGAPDDDRIRRLQEVVTGLEDQVARLEAAAGEEGLRDDIIEVAQRVQRLRVEVSDLQAEVDEYNEQLGDASEDDLVRLAARHRSLQNLLTRKRDERTEIRKLLEEDRRNHQELATKISRLGGPADPVLQFRHDLVLQLQELFTVAIAKYREQLRQAVQDEATRLFLLMSHEDDYSQLRINEQYGLEILDRDGDVVTGRSSGEEQLVALALVGALQKCAPVQGPIVIDMPFGRLDPRHRRKVIRALPEMSEQVLLLAFEGEFDAPAARSDLGPLVQAEKRLQRVTGRHTIIEDA